MIQSLKEIMHPELITRTETCEKHGEYTSRCYIGKMWSKCPVCVEEITAEDRRKEAEELNAKRLEAWQRKIGGSGIPERFHDRTLQTFVPETPEQEKALAFCKQYASNFAEVVSKGSSALFVGKPGTGKTHLACGVALQIMQEQNRTVYFTTVMRAIRRVKECWNKANVETESQAVAALAYPDLLILDEVGVQFGSEFERNILFDILNERYEKRKPTILMSNLPREQVITYLGERVMDRLREDGGRLIVFDWDSYRKKLREQA